MLERLVVLCGSLIQVLHDRPAAEAFYGQHRTPAIAAFFACDAYTYEYGHMQVT